MFKQVFVSGKKQFWLPLPGGNASKALVRAMLLHHREHRWCALQSAVSVPIYVIYIVRYEIIGDELRKKEDRKKKKERTSSMSSSRD